MTRIPLAAGHRDRFDHIVVAGAGLWNERSDQANLEFTRLLVAGRTREAGERSVRLLGPQIWLPGLAPVLGALIAWATLATASAEDLQITAEAMHAFDPKEVLPSIDIPVLLVVGDKDAPRRGRGGAGSASHSGLHPEALSHFAIYDASTAGNQRTDWTALPTAVLPLDAGHRGLRVPQPAVSGVCRWLGHVVADERRGGADRRAEPPSC